MINKPVILAICGKSASGKSTLAKWLSNNLNGLNIKHKIVISDTTRPPRVHEQHGVAYYFIDESTFLQGLKNNEYIEYTKFRNWYYGIHKSKINNKTDINILVINPEGLKTLKKYRREYLIIPIYLKDRLTDRLRRSYEREGCWKIEYFRRALVDWIDFINIEQTLEHFSKYIIIKNENGPVRKTRKILFMLKQYGLI